MRNKFSGVITALVTPFKKGEIDWASLERLIKAQLAAGIEGFVVCGTTAESPTLTESEKSELLKFVLKYVRHHAGANFPVIMGTGSNSTAETVLATQKAEALGADAALVVVPYYNRPPQRGLFQHFQKVAGCSKLPIILYNVPSRTIARLELDTIVELSRLPQIIGIKEASGDVSFGSQLVSECDPGFFVTSGDDGSFFDLTVVGGEGVISVGSHILPGAFVKWHRHGQSLRQRIEENRSADLAALEEFRAVQELISFLFVEANPIVIKMALFHMGLIDSPELRLPLVQLTEPLSYELKNKMKTAGLL